jgi:signal transduction histidine kinase/ligand-binding sensor domain-containing protein/DNA-binding response OmpR family regulator
MGKAYFLLMLHSKLIAAFCAFLYFPNCLNAQKIKFEHFTVEEGLQNNIVFAIAEDNKGLIWFATSTGVDRFDGTNYMHYALPQKNNTFSKYNQVPYLIADGKKQIWAATNTNIYSYNITEDKFEFPTVLNSWLEKNKSITGLFPSADAKSLLIANNNGFALYNQETQKILTPNGFTQFVRCLYQDNKGIIWVGTNKGIRRFVVNANGLTPLNEYPAVLNDLVSSEISGITQDGENQYWIATNRKGLFVYNDIVSTIATVTLPKSFGQLYAIKDMHYDSKSAAMFVSLDGAGLLKYDSQLDLIETYQTNEDDISTLSNNAVYDIFTDRYNRLWVSTYGGGVNVVMPEVQPFKNFQHEINNKNSLSNNSAKAITQDANGNLWFGTRKGISKLDLKSSTWQHYNEESLSPQFTTDNILALTKNEKNEVFAGTYGGGIMEFNNGQIGSFRSLKSDSSTIGTDFVYSLCYDSKGRLWSGGIRGPVSYLNTQTKIAQRLATPANTINCIIEDSKQNILIGTEKGVYVADGDKLVNYFPNNVTEKVNYILEYSPNVYWLGTLGSGIIVVNKSTNQKQIFRTVNGLPSDVICGLLKDANGNIWIGTSNGIAHYQTKNNSFTTYTKADGLAGSQINYGAAYQTSNGEMLFGTTNGFSMFNPKNIQTRGYEPKIVLTGLTISNKKVNEETEETPLEVQIDEVESLQLKYFQNSFHIDFVNAAPAVSGKHLYSWKLENFDKSWSQPSTIPTAVYTNIPSGKYVLVIKAFSKGQEDKASIRKLNITIKAAWWRTIWAYLAYLILLAAGINAAFTYFKVINTRRKFAERLRLNTSISHEIRTPLTLIKGPVNALSNATGISEEQKSNLELAKKNIQKLETIISQFIDFQKSGTSKLQMQVQKTDIVALVDDVTLSFIPLMKEKNIHFTYKRPSEKIELLFDNEKMEKVLNNLLSNAVKYTPLNKDIEVEVITDKTNVIITVADTGIGIPASEHQLLFKGYFRANNTINLKETGSGIGLSVVKEMVEIHHGKLSFTSTQNKGTSFTVKLPLQNEWLRPFIIDKKEENSTLYIPEIENNAITKASDKKIVIAEDNDELRLYLQTELQKLGYKVNAAINGKVALDFVQKNKTDLLITDIMMPEMNGFQLCANLKKDLSTCHIPIIMLTAISDKDYLLEGYKSGADDYVRKPFDVGYMQVRIENLLQNRTRFQNKIMHVFEQEEQVVKEDVDVIWLKNVTQIIADNIAKSDFSVEKLAALMAMSRPVLFRKFKAIANEAPQQYIINVRLRYAVEMLQKGTHNISEVAYMSGFEDPKYFSTAFKKHFGKSPREYVQDANK